jgi:uncharacterized protein (TIGR02001 family)
MKELFMRALALAVPLFLIAGVGRTAELPGGWSLEGEATVVSDYRFRGLSLSDKDPALQGGATLSAPNGLYGYVWGSSIEDEGEADGVEIDAGVGWAFSAGGFDVDVSANRYGYPGASDWDYWEFPLTVSRASGAWTTSLGGAYAPAQGGTGDEDNAYVFGKLERELAFARPVKLSAALGWEDGAFAQSKTDWTLGATTQFGPLELGLSYVGADDADETVVASITARF